VENVSEAVARIMRKHSVPMAMKPYRTLKTVLVHQKDKQEKEDLTECVYYKVHCWVRFGQCWVRFGHFRSFSVRFGQFRSDSVNCRTVNSEAVNVLILKMYEINTLLLVPSQAYNNVHVSSYFSDRNACMEHLLH